jgi:hypothetical protein
MITDECDDIQQVFELALTPTADVLDTPAPGVWVQGLVILYDDA